MIKKDETRKKTRWPMANHATPSFPRMITQQLIFTLQYQHTAKQISKEN